MILRIRPEFKLQDAWIGVYWSRSTAIWIDDEDQQDSAIWRARKADRVDIWLCVLPCVPIHVVVKWNERLQTESETIEDMIAF